MAGALDAAGFVAAKIAETVLAPSMLLLALSVVGFLLVAFRARRPGLLLLAAALGTECAAAVLPLDRWTLGPLEDRFSACRVPPPDTYGVIVLGGAVDTAVTEARGQPTLNGAAGRMTELVRAARLLPTATLAFTGGSGRILAGGLTEADVARMFFVTQGLADRPIIYEGSSRTTWENARNLAAILHPTRAQTWLLDTSAVHMPRAVAAFEAAGFDVIPDPVAYQTAPSFAAEIEPGFADRLGRLDEAAHEWAGLVAYRILERTRTLLPKRRPGLCPGPAGALAPDPMTKAKLPDRT